MTNDELRECLETIRESKGKLDAAVVVDYATPEDSPLHSYFEWEDTIAARRYREQQARVLVQRVSITYADNPESMRFYVAIKESSSLDSYEPCYIALADVEKRSLILEEARKELEAWQKRYAELEGLAQLLLEAAKQAA